LYFTQCSQIWFISPIQHVDEIFVPLISNSDPLEPDISRCFFVFCKAARSFVGRQQLHKQSTMLTRKIIFLALFGILSIEIVDGYDLSSKFLNTFYSRETICAFQEAAKDLEVIKNHI
jgi:hypothetical protein